MNPLLALLGGLLGGYGQGRGAHQQRADEQAARAQAQKNFDAQQAFQQKQFRAAGSAGLPALLEATKDLPPEVRSALRNKYLSNSDLLQPVTTQDNGWNPAPDNSIDDPNRSPGMAGPLRRNVTTSDPNAAIANATVPPSAADLAQKIGLMTQAQKYAGDVTQGAVGASPQVQQGAASGANKVLGLAGLPTMPIPFAPTGRERTIPAGQTPADGPMWDQVVPSRVPIGDGGFKVTTPGDSIFQPASVSKAYPVLNPGIAPTPETRFKAAQLDDVNAQAFYRRVEAANIPVKLKNEATKLYNEGKHQEAVDALAGKRFGFEVAKANAEFQDKDKERQFKAAEGDKNRTNAQDVARIRANIESARAASTQADLNQREASHHIVRLNDTKNKLASQLTMLDSMPQPYTPAPSFGNSHPTAIYPTFFDENTKTTRPMTNQEYNQRLALRDSIKSQLNDTNSLLHFFKERAGVVVRDPASGKFTQPGQGKTAVGKFTPAKGGAQSGGSQFRSPGTATGTQGQVLPGGRQFQLEGAGGTLEINVVKP